MSNNGVDLPRRGNLKFRAIAGLTSQLGENHTATLGAKHDLVLLLRRMGEFDEALRVCHDVVDGCALAYGTGHSETVGPACTPSALCDLAPCAPCLLHAMPYGYPLRTCDNMLVRWAGERKVASPDLLS